MNKLVKWILIIVAALFIIALLARWAVNIGLLSIPIT